MPPGSPPLPRRPAMRRLIPVTSLLLATACGRVPNPEFAHPIFVQPVPAQLVLAPAPDGSFRADDEQRAAIFLDAYRNGGRGPPRGRPAGPAARPAAPPGAPPPRPPVGRAGGLGARPGAGRGVPAARAGGAARRRSRGPGDRADGHGTDAGRRAGVRRFRRPAAGLRGGDRRVRLVREPPDTRL